MIDDIMIKFKALTLFSTPSGFGFLKIKEIFGSHDVFVVRGWNGLIDSSSTMQTAAAMFFLRLSLNPSIKDLTG